MRLHFGKDPTNRCTEILQKQNSRFWMENYHSRVLFLLQPSLYSFITQIVESMDTPIQEQHNHIEKCITVEDSRRKKFEIYLANNGSGLDFFSWDSGHFLGSNFGNKFGAMLSGGGPHKPESVKNLFAYVLP